MLYATGRTRDDQLTWRTVEQYKGAYWSGLDAAVYLNGVLLDDLVMLQWELQEPQQFVYNYARFVRSATLRGQRRVQGSFGINFRYEGYLFDLLKLGGTSAQKPSDSERVRLYLSTGVATHEEMAAALKSQKTSLPSGANLTNLTPEQIDKIAKSFEDSVWGEAATPNTFDTYRQGAFNSRYALSSQLDMTILFSLSQKQNGPPAQLGDRVTQGSPSDSAVRARRKIFGLEIVGEGCMLDDKGTPIMETYSFIAADLV